MTRRAAGQRGTSLTEILVAIAILALSIVPIVEFYTRVTGEMPAVTEDKLQAEMLATRILERYGATLYDELEKLVGQGRADVQEELFADDRKEDWYLAIPEYKKNVGIAKNFFKAAMDVRKLEEGLLAIDVVVTWRTGDRGDANDRPQSYALTRLVSRADLGVAYVKGEPEL